MGVHAQTLHLVEDRRMRSIGRVIAMHLARNDDAHRRRLRFHGPHLHRRSVCAQQQPVAQRTPLLIRNHQRILRIPSRMPRREVHALEVVEVGLDLRPHAHRVAQRGKHLGNLMQRLGDGMLSARQPPRARQRNIDRLSRQRRVTRPRPGRRFQNPFDQFLQCLEPLADRLLGFRRRGLEPPRGDLLEPPLFAPQPFQAKGLPEFFHVRRAAERSRIRARLALHRAEGCVQRGLIKCRQIGYLVVHRA